MSEKFSSTPWKEIQSTEVLEQTNLILSSYTRLTGKLLSQSVDSQSIYDEDFILLSHDGKDDPCFTYANKAAQDLWQLGWSNFIGMPSKYSAEPDQRESRSEMLNEAMAKGYFDSYTGIRVSSTGKRFYIKNATIFNLLNEAGEKVGQAAMFSNWKYLD
ncbi:MAG: MEKHLA domain-containing protein [Lentisphaerales bacterium]|nr:MEKHLA domain-containing protein [Lentisphaerales bacterium]